jgi:hypothetical protein
MASPAVPTGTLERELRAAYLRWLRGLPNAADIEVYLKQFQRQAETIIAVYGGQAASLGALAGFPVPRTLSLPPDVVQNIFEDMYKSAVSASITAGLNARDVARAMLNAGMDKGYSQLERLARTETVNQYWTNQWDSVRDLDLVMLWSTEESDRTCDECIERDGLVVWDESIRDHPNGRCTLKPTAISRVDYIGTLQPDGSIIQEAWPPQTSKEEGSGRAA